MAGVFTIRAPGEILEKRGMLAYGAVQRYIDRAVLDYCEPLVPKQSGSLIASGESNTKIGSGVVCYGAPYARYQYYGISKSGKPLTYHGGGKRGSYWFLRMKAVNLKTILAGAAKLAGGYPKLYAANPARPLAQFNRAVTAAFHVTARRTGK